MTAPAIVFLMYHELELPGRPLIQSEPGYVRYILQESYFRAQIGWLKQHGWKGIDVSAALQYRTEKTVAITFDDGCETDLIAAAPILKEAAFLATFYVTAGFIGKQGYMSPSQLRELRSSGFEIGCHSMTHPYLNDLAPESLRYEIVEARSKLEDILGTAVAHFSCPGGRYDDRTLALAKQAGYHSVANSRSFANSPATDPFQLGRVAIMRNTALARFPALCDGSALWKIRMGESVRSSARKLLGNRFYDRVRQGLLP